MCNALIAAWMMSMAGVGSNATSEAIALTQHAHKAGADAFLAPSRFLAVRVVGLSAPRLEVRLQTSAGANAGGVLSGTAAPGISFAFGDHTHFERASFTC